MMDITGFLAKYDQAVPRYTSYPTVPFWKTNSFDIREWKFRLSQTFFNEAGEVCIYVHLPFCEELCTYCACNKRVTKNHQVEAPYIATVLKEWSFYRELLSGPIIIKEIHLGGGTPTFFSSEHLTQLIEGLIQGCAVSLDHEFSVEVHPNFTTDDQLKTLRALGFNRISIGVQDFNPMVQLLINRIQTFDTTQHVVMKSRELGFEGVNIDLIYGLPGQTTEGLTLTMHRVEQLNPDRIAFYSYAHVPWKSKGQRRYTDEDVPKGQVKWEMYQVGREALLSMGYQSVGMDHFAKQEDKLMHAYSMGALHRNFMGYTTTNHQLLIGLGASAITDTWSAFSQNEKNVEDYQDKVWRGEFPLVNGHLLSRRDMVIRRFILSLMCQDRSTVPYHELSDEHLMHIREMLPRLMEDKLIRFDGEQIRLLPAGRMLIRNVAAVFDEYLVQHSIGGNTFSKAI